MEVGYHGRRPRTFGRSRPEVADLGVFVVRHTVHVVGGRLESGELDGVADEAYALDAVVARGELRHQTVVCGDGLLCRFGLPAVFPAFVAALGVDAPGGSAAFIGVPVQARSCRCGLGRVDYYGIFFLCGHGGAH